jgi:hypothetical protein
LPGHLEYSYLLPVLAYAFPPLLDSHDDTSRAPVKFLQNDPLLLMEFLEEDRKHVLREAGAWTPLRYSLTVGDFVTPLNYFGHRG